jgi:hypothetical protein
MTLSGWIFMFASWAVILGMFFYCMYRTLRNEDHDIIRADDQVEESEEV